jgi:excisionase family DNA binding protein
VVFNENTMSTHTQFTPPKTPKAKAGLSRLAADLQGERRLILRSGSGKPMTLPEELRRLLAKVVSDLSQGKSVAVISEDTNLTTREAADHLGMSRQYLVRLLEEGALSYHKVGSHRRLRLGEVESYKRRRDAHRRRVLDKLSETIERAGLDD